MKFKCPKCGGDRLIESKGKISKCKKCGFLDRRRGHGWVDPMKERRGETILDRVDWKG